VTWDTPLSNGGLALTGYEVIPYVDGVPQPSRLFKPSTHRCVINDLTKGDRYTFKVAALNQLGIGVLSTPTAALKL
jgi:hypothetical protein